MDGKTTLRKGSILGYGLFVMTITHTLTHVFGRLYTAIFPILREEFSLTIQQLGIFAAIPPLCQALLTIPSGLLTDKVGSRQMVIVSMVVAVLGSLLAALTYNPFMLIVAASLVYLNTTIYHPASYSFTTRLFTQRDRPKALGIHGAGGTVGIALGPLTLSLFLGFLGLTWRYVYLFWAIPLALGTIFVLRLREKDSVNSIDVQYQMTKTNPEEPISLLSIGLIIFLIFTAIRTMAGQMISTFMPIFIVDEKGLTVEQMGLVYGSLSLTGLISAPLGGFLAARFGAKRWLVVSLVMSLTTLSLVYIAPGVALFVILYLIYGFVGTLGMAARSTLVANLTPSSRRGIGYALLFLPGSIMGAISPVIAAHLISIFGMSHLFLITILISTIGIVILALGVRDTSLRF